MTIAIGYFIITLFLIPIVFGWFLVLIVPLGLWASKLTKHASKLNPKRVLIVEDDMGTKLMLEQIVRLASPAAIIALSDSEEEASLQLQEGADSKHNFDFVVADIFLTGEGTGVDLWRKAKSLRSRFLIASVVNEDTFERMVRSDGSEFAQIEKPLFLQKPFDPSECVEIIKRAIGD